MGQRIELPEGFRERILREAGADGAALLEALSATGPVTGVRLNPRKPADTGELLRGAGRERGQLLAAVDGLTQERELLLHGLDLLFASHMWFLPVMNWLFKAKPARH